MGFSHDKIFRIILFAALFLLSPVLQARSDKGITATFGDVMLPHYKDGKYLQFILYGKRTVSLGATVTLYDPLIDIADKDLPDVEVIEQMDKISSPDPKVGKIKKLDPNRIYPLHTDYGIVRQFWARFPHSKAVITSDVAIYDKIKKTLTGEGYVYFRSRDMDIDGVGFDASQKAKFIYIRKNVRVVYRPHARELTDEAKQLLEQKWNKIKNER